MSRYVDLQVNGYGGVDFNADDLTADDLRRACAALAGDGVEQFLLTLITDAVETMAARLRGVAAILDAHPDLARQVAGVHIEGPFFPDQPGFIGAHPSEHACMARRDFVDRLLDAGGGYVRLWTLAPECDPDATITADLTQRGLVVAAGHTDASRDQLQRCIDAGLALFTHFGNGCPVLLPRHDNILQRVLSLADQLHISFIADGHHIPLFALKNYLQLVAPEHVIMTTDAIAAAGLGPGRYPLGGRFVRVAPGDAPRFDDSGQLAGSAATMPMIEANLHQLGYARETIDRWCRHNATALLDSTVT